MRQYLRSYLEAAGTVAPFSRVLLWRGPRRSRRIALTFDDGPSSEYTDEVLAILASADVRATFFLLGSRVARWPELTRRIAAAGHELAVHGWDHTCTDLPGQVARTAAALTALGLDAALFRPPGGKLDVRTLTWMTLHRWRTVMWSFDMADSLRHEGKRHRRVDYDQLTGGDIVLAHDDNPVCTAELPVLLDAAGRAGLAVGTVSALLAERPPGPWDLGRN